MNERFDVAIVGAGPAGTSAAYELARAGRSVVVIDKASFPRDKCCGDGLTTAALRHLQHMGLDPKRIPSWTPVHETTWRSPSSHTIRLTVPSDKGLRIAVARRAELDAELVNIARAAGADIREATPLDDASVDGGHVLLKTATGVIETRYAIGADGIYSPLRKALTGDTSRYLGDIHAFRQYFQNVTGEGGRRLWVAFEKDLLPGYFWIFPLGNGRANVGFGIERHSGQTVQWMRYVWPDLLSRPHIREALGLEAQPESPHKAWPIPTGIDRAMLSHGGRVLFVGDAARSVDPLTGEGIAQALGTGAAAANAILRYGYSRDGRQVASFYESQVKRGMANDHRFARALASVVRHDAGARLAIRMAPLGPQRGRYAMRWVFEDNPRAALLTPWRWRERFSEKPTVYN